MLLLVATARLTLALLRSLVVPAQVLHQHCGTELCAAGWPRRPRPAHGLCQTLGLQSPCPALQQQPQPRQRCPSLHLPQLLGLLLAWAPGTPLRLPRCCHRLVTRPLLLLGCRRHAALRPHPLPLPHPARRMWSPPSRRLLAGAQTAQPPGLCGRAAARVRGVWRGEHRAAAAPQALPSGGGQQHAANSTSVGCIWCAHAAAHELRCWQRPPVPPTQPRSQPPTREPHPLAPRVPAGRRPGHARQQCGSGSRPSPGPAATPASAAAQRRPAAHTQRPRRRAAALPPGAGPAACCVGGALAACGRSGWVSLLCRHAAACVVLASTQPMCACWPVTHASAHLFSIRAARSGGSPSALPPAAASASTISPWL
jgi:hypothetical protein